MPRTTAQVAPYVECLGHELAVRFLLDYGGAELYLASGPKGRSAVEALVGPEAVARMADHYQLGQRVRVPLARQWLARMLHWQDNSTAEAPAPSAPLTCRCAPGSRRAGDDRLRRGIAAPWLTAPTRAPRHEMPLPDWTPPATGPR
ncbi:MAG: hypothetical protein IPF96_06125 [Rhodobacter sp.]|nr:hypothetical protein [Rhodobacter sp.]